RRRHTRFSRDWSSDVCSSDLWISRFEIWPWLERFSTDVEREVVAELGGRPDLVVGNYSDGNLVATLLARRLGVTQCAIAHALERSEERRVGKERRARPRAVRY